MAANREGLMISNTLANHLANFKATQWGITTTVVGHDETQWNLTNGLMSWMNSSNEVVVGAVQKYYTGGAWVRCGNVFADIEADEIYTDTGFKDQFLVADLLLSEAGETALNGAFTATSIVGALNELKVPLGIIVNTTRKTDADSPYTIVTSDYYIPLDTDGCAVTANLPIGITGTSYIIKNCGSSGNLVTLVPNGAELIEGVNDSQLISDGESFHVIYEATEGWRIV